MSKAIEELKNLRIALYEAKKDNPLITYRELADEFNIHFDKAKKLIQEYCKMFNLEQPVDVIDLRNKNEKKVNKLIGKKVSFDGKTGKMINELNRVYVIHIDGEESPAVYLRKDLTRVSK